MAKKARVLLPALTILILIFLFYPTNPEIDTRVYENVAKIEGVVTKVVESNDSTIVEFDNGKSMKFAGLSPVPIFYSKVVIWYDKNSKVIIGVQ